MADCSEELQPDPGKPSLCVGIVLFQGIQLGETISERGIDRRMKKKWPGSAVFKFHICRLTNAQGVRRTVIDYAWELSGL